MGPGAWSKMMTAPPFPGGVPANAAAQMAAALADGKMIGPHRDLLDKSPSNHSNHPEDLASFKALSNDDDLNGTSDLDSEMASENDDEVPANEQHQQTDDEFTAKKDNNNISMDKAGDELESCHKEIMDKLKRQDNDDDAQVITQVEKTESRKRKLSSCEDDKDDSGAISPRSSNSPTGERLEIKTQRPMGLLAQHGLTTKSQIQGLNLSHHHGNHQHSSQNANKEAEEIKTEPQTDRDGVSGAMVDRGLDKETDRGLGPSYHSSRLPPLDFTHPAFLDRQFSHPMHQAPASPLDEDGLGAPTGGHHWTFEEQFKQLYELSEDTKRKEFLDDLFNFMQKRGTPVNRIPIMAKQPLDLYELFRLVVSKGGLVEVINKKLWREICKGLNLPSSITSAAFTLRTQYMKYLYPYECEKLKLSNPAELQAAIDGNRREGRRPGYGYDFSPIPTMIPPSPHVNGLMNGVRSLHSLGGEDDPLPSPPPHIRSLAEREHLRAMEAAHHVMEQAKRNMEEAHRNGPPPHQPMLPLSKAIPLPVPTSGPPIRSTSPPPPVAPPSQQPPTSKSEDSGPPPAKRMTLEEDMMRERFERFIPPPFGIPSTHLKITSRNDGRSEFDNSLVVSMEVNGIMYQGVLFAQHPRRI